jgi:hypothetical protein
MSLIFRNNIDLKELVRGWIPKLKNLEYSRIQTERLVDAPDSFDWRTQGYSFFFKLNVS